MMNRFLPAGLTRLLVGFGFVLGAALASAALHAEGDAEQGAVLAYTCMGCHSIEGQRNAYPSYRVPRLAGQHPQYIEIALKAYKSGERSHPTMVAQAASLSDQDIEDLAAWVASYGGPETPASDSAAKAPKAAETCVACHGERGISVNAIWPNLAGQHEDYIANSLLQYQLAAAESSQGNSVRNNGVMSSMVANLTAREIDQLAAWFASQDGLFTTSKRK